MNPYLNLALGIVHLLKWIVQNLNAADRRRVSTLLATKGLTDAVDADLDRMRRASKRVSDPNDSDYRGGTG